MFKEQKILILGVAKSGYAAAKFLAKDNEVIVTDKKDQEESILNEFKKLGITFIKSEFATELITNKIDVIVKNPGIEPTHPAVEKANNMNIPIINEMEVAYHYLPKNVKIIGITGSNGKTTTTTMIYDLLQLHGLDVTLGGNIGYPLCDVVEKIKDNSLLVLEISDHQLYNFKDFKTNYSILTNLCPTHLDFHGNYENYINVKKKIFNHHTIKDKAYINFKNPDSMNITKDIPSTKIYFNDEHNYYNNNGIYIDNELVIKLDEIKINGEHNYENILVTLLLVKEFAWDLEIIKDYFKKFNGVEHRLEVVDTNSGILFYNDSKATNPTSTLIALKTMKLPTRLILGGKERGQDFHELNEYINKVKCIYAIGEVTKRVESYAKDEGIPCICSYTLEEAVKKIKEDAKSGEAVLLSPASASWDQYDKFETRGEEFKKLVEKMFN